jgi:formylglycine-generating enzyme required for sulfatase activity
VIRRASIVACAFAVIAASCARVAPGPRAQWTILVTTDAPLPQLGDRLLIEIADDATGAPCALCRHLFEVSATDAWPLSFGALPASDGRALRVRARLYRDVLTGADGLPSGDALIDAVGRLAPSSGDAEVMLVLRADCFGVRSDARGGTCDPATRALVPAPPLAAPTPEERALRPGQWTTLQPAPCTGAPPGMICLDGGVFVLGGVEFVAGLAGYAPLPERLVRVGPFAIDGDELTVGAIRALVRSGAIGAEPTVRGSDSMTNDGACTYLGASDGANDGLPINCVSVDLARAACAALGKRLPSEAEWELAAGNRTDETQFPWGSATDACGRSILERGREIPTEIYQSSENEHSGCRAGDAGMRPWGPVAGGATADVTQLGIRNMAGNVSEWVADDFVPYDDSNGCWAKMPFLETNPVCSSSTATLHAQRGSNWASVLERVYERDAAGGGPSPLVGVRCAKSM